MKLLNFDCGLSMSPRLERSPENISHYKTFLDRLAIEFKGKKDPNALTVDKTILITPSTPNASVSKEDAGAFFHFMLEGYPKIPANPVHCDQFEEFSLSFRDDGGLSRSAVEDYTRRVYLIAKECFGKRVKYWHGLCRTRGNKQWGYYCRMDMEREDDIVRKLCQDEV
ncbi:hypothetical protein NW762_012552 [Fusarium torreyae]|uniref:Uncharacterized protein n=1 Tax=Fusarium torreyae TaxID=1237075 RepID=A0A9W8VB86_9HYPO|nr:hypothetical protein NW762_012552 [Fusarium torreyae]